MNRRAEAPSVAEQSIQEFQNKKTGTFPELEVLVLTFNSGINNAYQECSSILGADNDKCLSLVFGNSYFWE